MTKQFIRVVETNWSRLGLVRGRSSGLNVMRHGGAFRFWELSLRAKKPISLITSMGNSVVASSSLSRFGAPASLSRVIEFHVFTNEMNSTTGYDTEKTRRSWKLYTGRTELHTGCDCCALASSGATGSNDQQLAVTLCTGRQ